MKTRIKERTVYVVAWDCESSGGFDWYPTAKEADAAFEEEKKNCAEFKADRWTAYRFDLIVPQWSNVKITEEIDRVLMDCCAEKTTKRFRA